MTSQTPTRAATIKPVQLAIGCTIISRLLNYLLYLSKFVPNTLHRRDIQLGFASSNSSAGVYDKLKHFTLHRSTFVQYLGRPSSLLASSVHSIANLSAVGLGVNTSEKNDSGTGT